MTFNQAVVALVLWLFFVYLAYGYISRWRKNQDITTHITFFIGLFSVLILAIGYSVYATSLIWRISFLPYSIVCAAGIFAAYKFLEKASGKRLTRFLGSFPHLILVIALMIIAYVLGELTGSPIFSAEARRAPYLLIYELSFVSFCLPAVKFAKIFWQFSRNKHFDLLSRLRALGISAGIGLALLSVVGTAVYLLSPYYPWFKPASWWTIPGSITVILFLLVFLLLCWMPAPVKRFFIRVSDLLSLRDTLKDTSNLLIYLNDARLNMIPQTNQLMLNLTERLCKKLKLSKDETEATIEAARLFGVTPPKRLAVQEEILKGYKRNPYDKKGVEPAMAFREEVQFYNQVCEVTRHCTERFNGKGYPERLKGDKIPQGSQIVAIVDHFCNRYPTEEEAVTAIRLKSGWMFDPKIVDAFMEVIKESEEKRGEVRYSELSEQ